MVFSGVPIACVSDSGIGLNQNSYSFIPVCANLTCNIFYFVFNLLR